jgi:2-methylisocitrate lyase-like PEP mutase family enzyme
LAATPREKGAHFRALHQGPDPFVIANAWDGGSARLLAKLGFPALATSSGASAATAEAARALPFPFLITARSEGFLWD